MQTNSPLTISVITPDQERSSCFPSELNLMFKHGLASCDHVHKAGIKSPRSTIFSSSSLKYWNSARMWAVFASGKDSVHSITDPVPERDTDVMLSRSCSVDMSASFEAYLWMSAWRCNDAPQILPVGFRKCSALMNSLTPLKAIKWYVALPAVTLKGSIPFGNARPQWEVHHNKIPLNSSAAR